MKTRILALVFGLALIATSACADVYVVDGSGKIVGSYSYDAEVDGGALVLRNINGLWFQIPVQKDGLGLPADSSYSASALYSSVDCTGTAYMEPAVFPVGALVLGVTNTEGNALIRDGILLYPNINAQPAAMPICSEWDGGFCGTINCETLDVAPALTFRMSNLGFRPPFSIKRTSY